MILKIFAVRESFRRFKQYGTSLTDKSIRGGPSSASSSVVTAEIMETDTDLLMPVPEESPYFPEKYPGKVCACARSANAASWARAKWTDRGQEQCQIDGGGRAVVLGRRRGILRAQSQSGGQTGSGGGGITLGISPLLSSKKR
ncbi:hypothetical protein pipiens_015466 [Culex pipiens pipiens]|uniref:Uncharacterized protein n=1 Tax=Culex pipiens pipiens TaxID=38569 RepID=A0ABD1CQE1_CULPP